MNPLLRDKVFRRYWSGQSISMFGDQITSIALPLVAVLTLHANAAQMGFLAALVWVPSLLFGVPAGVWVDRHGHRRAKMILADLGRAALLAGIPVAYALGALTIWQLYAVAFGVGTFSVFFTVCNPALFVAIVADDRYVDGNALVHGSRALSMAAGPAAGGLLVQLLTAPFALVADALSFVASAVFLSRIRPGEAPRDPAVRGALASGITYIWTTALVRSTLIATALINFFNFVFAALFVLYATRVLHVQPGLLGLVLGAGAAGGVLGALISKRLTRRFGAGRVFTGASLVFTAPFVLVPLAGGGRPLVLAMLFAAELVGGCGLMILDISFSAIFAAVIPDQLRARVGGAFHAVNYGTRPLGAVAGGMLAAAVGIRPTLWLATLGATTGFCYLLRSPLPRFRLPGPGTPEPAATTPPPIPAATPPIPAATPPVPAASPRSANAGLTRDRGPAPR